MYSFLPELFLRFKHNSMAMKFLLAIVIRKRFLASFASRKALRTRSSPEVKS